MGETIHTYSLSMKDGRQVSYVWERQYIPRVLEHEGWPTGKLCVGETIHTYSLSMKDGRQVSYVWERQYIPTVLALRMADR